MAGGNEVTIAVNIADREPFMYLFAALRAWRAWRDEKGGVLNEFEADLLNAIDAFDDEVA